MADIPVNEVMDTHIKAVQRSAKRAHKLRPFFFIRLLYLYHQIEDFPKKP